jgi:serine/threonine protein kinase
VSILASPWSHVPVLPQATKRTLSQLHTEIVALKTLNHPNILQLLHVELDAMYPKKNMQQVRWNPRRMLESRVRPRVLDVCGLLRLPMLRQVPSIVLALQLAEGGELFDFMMFTGSFSETVSRTICRQLLSALQVRMKNYDGIRHRTRGLTASFLAVCSTATSGASTTATSSPRTCCSMTSTSSR